MRTQWRDLCAGGMCVLTGGGTAAQAWQYPLGTLREIGPGFHPLCLGVMLGLVGVLIAGTAFTGTPEPDEPAAAPEWRGWICIVSGVALFILLVGRAGLALAAFASVLVWALGDRSTSWRGALLLALCIAVFGTVLFGVFLGVNLPLWPTGFSA